MTRPDLDSAVRAYLERFGAQEPRTLALSLKVGQAAVLGALRRLGAMPRCFGHWDKHPAGSAELEAAFERINAARFGGSAKSASRVYAYPPSPKAFTLYALPKGGQS